MFSGSGYDYNKLNNQADYKRIVKKPKTEKTVSGPDHFGPSWYICILTKQLA